MQSVPFFNSIFGISILFLFGSLWFWQKKQSKAALFCLFVAAFGLRFWAASLDPFLNNWDERWHALVARKLMTEPLRPRLRDVAWLPYDLNAWCCNFIWLHKPPLFLWQMAASMAFFGKNVVAMRLPSVILGAVLVPAMFRLGKNLLGAEVGFMAAWLSALSFYQLELTSGRLSLDHNNLVFTAYVTLSFWALSEFWVSGKWTWLILTSLFSGCAVLTKWLLGLLVFIGAVVGEVLFFKKTIQKRVLFEKISLLALAAGAAVSIYLPWFFFTKSHFPLETASQISHNLRHISETLDEQGGSIFNYFRTVDEIFFLGSLPLAFVGMWLAWHRSEQKKLANCLIFSTLGILTFFSLVVKTKMVGYFLMVEGLFLLFLAVLFQAILEFFNQKWSRSKRLVQPIGLLAFGLLIFQPLRIWRHHRSDFSGNERVGKTHNTLIYKQLDEKLSGNNWLVIGLPEFEELDLMFFSEKEAYGWVPDEQLPTLEKSGLRLAAFQNTKPDWWFAAHPTIFKIEEDLSLPK